MRLLDRRVANALIIVPEWETRLPADDTVDVLILP